MYEVIKEVITAKTYELVDMLKKIDKLWVESKITDEQRDELVSLARENAIPEESMAPILDRIFDLELRVKALEEAGTEPKPEPVEPEEWKQPTGGHDAYNIGDRVKYNGHIYESTINANVWSPETYPQGWKKIS